MVLPFGSAPAAALVELVPFESAAAAALVGLLPLEPGALVENVAALLSTCTKNCGG